MRHDYVCEYGRIILQPLDEESIEPLRILRNSVRQYFLESAEIEQDSQLKWYKRYLEKDNDIMFKVVKKENAEDFVGAVALYDIDWEQGIAEYGRVLVDKEKAPEKGIGQEVLCAVFRFGFEKLNLKKIVGEIKKDNLRSLKAVMHAGGRVVGESEDGALKLIEVTPSDMLSEVDD